MIKFEVLGQSREDLKAKLEANFKADEEQLPEWEPIFAGVAALVDVLPEPTSGKVIAAQMRIDLARGSVSIHFESFSSTVLGPDY